MSIDKNRNKAGKWLLTGSQQFHLMKNISESLAGRIAIFELLPFSLIEYPAKKKIDDLIWNGGYPEPSLNPEKREVWISSYIQTYIERDVRQLQNIKDMRIFESFIGLLAARHAQVFNASILSRECGISVPTIKSWLSVLEASYLCILLPPYYKNYGKRLVKSPKLYFIDSAIVCELTRQPDKSSAISGAMAGALFEGFIVSETIKIFSNAGKKRDIFFWRSHDGLEVDLIIQLHKKLYPVEIKLTATPSVGHLQAIEKFKLLSEKDASGTGLLVCATEKVINMPGNNIALPYFKFSEWLKSQLM
jgi:predicted AAA+ superfamily ATPase